MSLPQHCPDCGDHLRVSSTDRETRVARFVCKGCHRIVCCVPQDEKEWVLLSHRAAENQRTKTVP